MDAFTRALNADSDTTDLFQSAQADVDETHTILLYHHSKGARRWTNSHGRLMAYVPARFGFTVATLQVGH